MQKQIMLRTAIADLLEQIQARGLKDISVKDYYNTYHKLLSFAQENEVVVYSRNLVDSFLRKENNRCLNGDICPEYFRFIKRSIRLLISYFETGHVDFSKASQNLKKYIPSVNNLALVEGILDYSGIHSKTRVDLNAVMRHFFCYIENKKLEVADLTDDDFFDFMFSIASVTNAGSIGRTLRGLRYIHDYLKHNKVAKLEADLSMLQFKNEKIRVIPPFSQVEISSLLDAIASDSSLLALRDYAVILLGFNTGLRASDIRKLKMSDIDWKQNTVTVTQSKTGQVLVLPLHGTVMNAVADYILKGRPECGFSEIFITSRAPYHPLKGGSPFTQIIDKYSASAGVENKPMRSFHSLRRSFATELSSAAVPLTMISQMLGHKGITQARPYLSYNQEQISFCAMDFSDVPIRYGIYHDLLSEPTQKGGAS